jgi:hypothetical protein
MGLYDEVKASGAWICNNTLNDTLYVEVTEATTALLEKYGKKLKKCALEQSGKICYTVHFAYTPYWELMKEAAEQQIEICSRPPRVRPPQVK